MCKLNHEVKRIWSLICLILICSLRANNYGLNCDWICRKMEEVCRENINSNQCAGWVAACVMCLQNVPNDLLTCYEVVVRQCENLCAPGDQRCFETCIRVASMVYCKGFPDHDSGRIKPFPPQCNRDQRFRNGNENRLASTRRENRKRVMCPRTPLGSNDSDGVPSGNNLRDNQNTIERTN